MLCVAACAGADCSRASDNDDVHLCPQEIADVRGYRFDVVAIMAKLKRNVASFDIPEVVHPAYERLPVRIVVRGSGPEISDARGLLGLLRPRRERPRRRAAEQSDELTPFQLTKLHALTLAKVTAYWIGEHQVRGLPPCGISVRPMTVQGQSEPKGAAKYNRFRAGMAGKQTRNQCMMFRNSWQGSAKADPSPLALFGRPSFVDPN